MPLFETIGLITKTEETDVADAVAAIYSHLLRRGFTVLLDASAGHVTNDAPTYSRSEIGERCQLVVVIGGDGTLLSAARGLSTYDVPLVGVNLGRLGFLVDVPTDDQLVHLDQILAGNYQEERRFLLESEVYRDDEVLHRARALNDVVLRIKNVVRMIEFETYIDGRFVNTQRADGLIVSTPTGSTAYALSGGGPIISPALDALVLLPVCPHTLSSRPIVVRADSQIEIRVGEANREVGQLVCDGQSNVSVVPGDSIRVHRADRSIRFLHPQDHDFYHILREKLHWS